MPNQGTDRMWLKAIGNPSTEAENIMRCKVENMMKPFLDYVTKQNPYLTHWKVGALRTAPQAKSQYEKCNNQLHADYTEGVMNRPWYQRPMSMIMALDKFEFLYEFDDPNNDDDDNEGIKQMTVNKGEAIAFTNECFHAGGQNSSNKFLYHLFV